MIKISFKKTNLFKSCFEVLVLLENLLNRIRIKVKLDEDSGTKTKLV